MNERVTFLYIGFRRPAKGETVWFRGPLGGFFPWKEGPTAKSKHLYVLETVGPKENKE